MDWGGAAKAAVGELQPLGSELGDEARNLLMRQLQELVQQAEVIQHLHGRRMNGIATEITQEIRMLLEHDGLDTGTRQQETQHQPSRPATGNATGRLDGRRAR